MVDHSTSRKRAWLIFISGLLLTTFAIFVLDRFVATWSYQNHLRSYRIFDALTHLVDHLDALAIVSLVIFGLLAALGGWRPGARALIAIEACLSIIIAIAVKEWLKVLCGRTWPETWTDNNPSWISNHVFGFFPLHGGEGWHSFPSGHSTIMAALMGVLWWRLPRWRWAWWIPLALVVVGLLGANYHWVGDIIAGIYIGVSVSFSVVAFTDYLRRTPE